MDGATDGVFLGLRVGFRDDRFTRHSFLWATPLAGVGESAAKVTGYVLRGLAALAGAGDQGDWEWGWGTCSDDRGTDWRTVTWAEVRAGGGPSLGQWRHRVHQELKKG